MLTDKTMNSELSADSQVLLLRKKQRTFKSFMKRNWRGYLFLAPFVILFTTFIIIPVICAVVLSFTNYNMLQDATFVGFNNYKLLFLDDDIFIIAIGNTMAFALVCGPVGYILSFFAAWVINQLKFRKAFELAFYAPSLASGVAMSQVWMIMFSGDRYGYLNNFLINLGLIDTPILWTTNPDYIMTVIVVIQLWMSMGTGFLVLVAGLQNVSREYYEAGAIDGVKNKFQELFYITIPLLKPQLLFNAINSIVGAFGVFDIAVSVAGMPSPQYAGHTIVAHLYDYAFIRFQMGYASAIAVVLFVITFLLGKVVMKLLSSKDE